MFVYKFCLGLDTNGHDVDAKQIALDLAAKYFPGGHTVYEANGRWTGKVGVIDEPTIVIEWMTSTADEKSGQAENQARMFAFQYKVNAYQESVLISKREEDAFFI